MHMHAYLILRLGDQLRNYMEIRSRSTPLTHSQLSMLPADSLVLRLIPNILGTTPFPALCKYILSIPMVHR